MAQSNTFLIFCIFFILIGGIIGLAVFLGITFHRLDAEKRKTKDGGGGGDSGGGGGGTNCPDSKRATLLDKETILKFDSTNFDTYWTKEVSWHGGGNDELQSYEENNVTENTLGGNLVIEARIENEEKRAGKPFTSGKIVGKVGLKRGRVSFTAILPEGLGLWPAFWLLPDDIALNQSGGDLYACTTWPGTGEIDVMEMRGNEPNKIIHVVHSGHNYRCKKDEGLAAKDVLSKDGGKWSGTAHTYWVEWDKEKMTFGTDSDTNHTITFADIWDAGPCNPRDEFFMDGTKPCPQPVGKICNPFTQDTVFVPIINLAVGGQFVGSPSAGVIKGDGAAWPKQMTIMDVTITPKE